jgi:hypothetical protein
MFKAVEPTSLSRNEFCRLSRWFALSALAASLTLLASARVGAQDPANSPANSNDQQQSQTDPQQPAAQPDVDKRRVISKDTIPQPGQAKENPQDTPQEMDGPASTPPQRASSRNRPPATIGPVPASITILAGKVISVRLNEPLSSDHNHVGDSFTATLDQPIVVDGWVVARRGETIVGSVTAAKKAGRIKGVSQLGLQLTDVTVVDGQQLPMVTELWNGSAGTSHGADAAGVATTTGVGTIIGAAADGGAGAGIGAGAGAAAGIALVLLTRGKPTVLGPETVLSFRLKEPLTISTENSRQAFLPVKPNDYKPSPTLRGRGNAYAVVYPPYYAPCGYWGCGGPYYYYGPSFAFYRGYYGGYHRGYRHGRFHY